MTRKTIRRFFQSLTEKPKNRWEATMKMWDRTIWLGFAAVTWISSAVTNNMGTLLLLLWITAGGFIIYYFYLAKGR